MRPLVKLFLMHLIGNAALLGLAYYWLSVGESSTSMLALSIAILVIFFGGAVWLHGSALAYFRSGRGELRQSLSAGVRHLPPLLLFAIVTFAIDMSLGAWDPSSLLLSIASFFTMTFQKPVRPQILLRIWEVILWLLRWCVLPVILLPLAAAIAQWSGFGEFGAQIRNWKHWLLIPALLLVGIWLPLRLVAWVPIKGTFSAELISFVLRFAAGYLLFVAGCLAVAFVTSRGRPALSQPSTVPSP